MADINKIPNMQADLGALVKSWKRSAVITRGATRSAYVQCAAELLEILSRIPAQWKSEVE